MVAVQAGVGGALAFLLLALAVVSLPLFLGREVDLVSAMLPSLRSVARNPVVLGAWALLVAVSTLLAVAPWFLVVLPVRGHATRHLSWGAAG